MKIKIGPYKNWFGPYQLAEALCFWAPKVKDEHGFPKSPDWVHKFGDFLAHGKIIKDEDEDIKFLDRDLPTTRLNDFLVWLDSKKKRKVKIHIDRYDTWSMDHTLSMIIVPMLKQLKETKHGSPYVDLEDAPEHLHPSKDRIKLSEEGKVDKWDVDDKIHERWDWAMGEMIYAFECELDENWENQFHSGSHDIYFQRVESGNFEMKHGPNDTFSIDREAMDAAWKRRDNGRRLFAKYYHNLWD